MTGFVRKLTATAAAIALVAVPTAGIAAAQTTPRPAATQAAAAPVSPWLTLSAMTSSSSSAASTAALQYEDEGPGFPPIAPLIVILGTIALGVYILTKDDDDDDLGFPVSP
jgi:hypothetical protein